MSADFLERMIGRTLGLGEYVQPRPASLNGGFESEAQLSHGTVEFEVSEEMSPPHTDDSPTPSSNVRAVDLPRSSSDRAHVDSAPIESFPGTTPWKLPDTQMDARSDARTVSWDERPSPQVGLTTTSRSTNSGVDAPSTREFHRHQTADDLRDGARHDHMPNAFPPESRFARPEQLRFDDSAPTLATAEATVRMSGSTSESATGSTSESATSSITRSTSSITRSIAAAGQGASEIAPSLNPAIALDEVEVEPGAARRRSFRHKDLTVETTEVGPNQDSVTLDAFDALDVSTTRTSQGASKTPASRFEPTLMARVSDAETIEQRASIESTTRDPVVRVDAPTRQKSSMQIRRGEAPPLRSANEEADTDRSPSIDRGIAKVPPIEVAATKVAPTDVRQRYTPSPSDDTGPEATHTSLHPIADPNPRSATVTAHDAREMPGSENTIGVAPLPRTNASKFAGSDASNRSTGNNRSATTTDSAATATSTDAMATRTDPVATSTEVQPREATPPVSAPSQSAHMTSTQSARHAKRENTEASSGDSANRRSTPSTATASTAQSVPKVRGPGGPTSSLPTSSLPTSSLPTAVRPTGSVRPPVPRPAKAAPARATTAHTAPPASGAAPTTPTTTTAPPRATTAHTAPPASGAAPTAPATTAAPADPTTARPAKAAPARSAVTPVPTPALVASTGSAVKRPSTRQPSPAEPIQIRIGRIEVRSPSPPVPVEPKRRGRHQPPMDLDSYFTSRRTR